MNGYLAHQENLDTLEKGQGVNWYFNEWLYRALKRRKVVKVAKVVEYITQHDEHMYDLAAYDTWMTWRAPRAI